jgi:PAS domain S-box-containing protein
MESQTAPDRVGPHWTSFFAHLDETIVLLTDSAGFIAYASPSVTRWLGYRPTELVGAPLELLIHPHEAVELVMAMANCTATAPGSGVHRLKTADGGWCTLELTLVSLRSDALAGGVLVAAREAS